MKKQPRPTRRGPRARRTRAQPVPATTAVTVLGPESDEAVAQDVAGLRSELVDRLTLLEAKTRQILERAKGLAGTSRKLAREILRLIPIARDKEASGQDAALEVAQLSELHRRITRLVTAPLVEHAVRLRRGGKRGRKLALRRVIEPIVAEGVTDYNAVLNRLEILAGTRAHPVIDEVLKRRGAKACDRLECKSDYHVHWRTAPGHRLRTTGYKAIRNMVSRIVNS